jgi:quinol monooxygenase YgiN
MKTKSTTKGEKTQMSVLITVTIDGDTEKFRQSLVDRADEYSATADKARAAGAIHHRFGAGDGFILVVDEWSSEEQFHGFFSNPDLQEFITEIGGDLTSVVVIVTEALESPDQF